MLSRTFQEQSWTDSPFSSSLLVLILLSPVWLFALWPRLSSSTSPGCTQICVHWLVMLVYRFSKCPAILCSHSILGLDWGRILNYSSSSWWVSLPQTTSSGSQNLLFEGDPWKQATLGKFSLCLLSAASALLWLCHLQSMEKCSSGLSALSLLI